MQGAGNNMLSTAELETFLSSGAVFGTAEDGLTIGWGKQIWTSTPSKKHPSSFYFPDFFLKQETPWLSFEHQIKLIPQELLAVLPSVIDKDPFIGWKTHSKDIFLQSIEQLKQIFIEGILVKAVPYVIDEAAASMSATRLVKSLSSALNYICNHPGYIYGFWNGSQGLLGVTPEILFSLKQIKKKWILQSMALAGTAKDPKQIASAKNLHEHAIVVEGISSVLSHFGCVEVGAQQILQLPGLSHLMTPLTLQIDAPPSFIFLVQALHPSPALGAFPKASGKQWLENYAKLIARQRYGAPIALLTNGSIQCCVGIRSVQWIASKLFIGAGCGVIKTSDPQEEWLEIEMKLHAIKELLAL
jgi:isochorismate synthase EntC